MQSENSSNGILPDQSHHSAMRFFLMAGAFYARFGISIRGLLTDNGSCYKHWLFRRLLAPPTCQTPLALWTLNGLLDNRVRMRALELALDERPHS